MDVFTDVFGSRHSSLAHCSLIIDDNHCSALSWKSPDCITQSKIFPALIVRHRADGCKGDAEAKRLRAVTVQAQQGHCYESRGL